MWMSLLLIFSANVSLDSLDYLYKNRHKDKSYLSFVKNELEKMYKENPQQDEVIWRLARVYFTYGDNARSKDKKLYWYNKGKNKAKELINKNPSHPEGHFWYGVNLGRIGQTKGVLNSLGLAPTIRKSFEKTLQLNPKHTGALDGLGVFYYEIPSYIGGSLKKSLNYLKKALSIDPNYTVLYIDIAKVYIKKKEYSKARYYLKKVLNISNPTNPADYYLDDKPEAIRLLNKIKDK